MKPPDLEEDATIPTDLATLVSAMGAAHTATGRSDPHSPWLPPLPEDDRYRLSLDDYAEIGPIMAAIQAEGGTIQDMEVTQPDLEDVFLRLMQEN